MEKFEVYVLDDVFYSIEEIENMGLTTYSYNALKEELGNKDCFYQIKTISSLESGLGVTCISDAKEYLASLSITSNIFFKDCGNDGISIDFRKYYGIKFKNEYLLFRIQEERNNNYLKLEQLISSQFTEIMGTSATIKTDSSNYSEQKQIKQKQKKLLGIVQN